MFLQRRRARLAAVVALAAVVLTGCHASATVAVRVRADGSGTVAIGVTVDHAASVALSAPGTSTPDVPLHDLVARGWSVGPWQPADGGGATIALSKPFTGGAGLAAVLAEVDGREGALRDVHVARTRALLRDRDAVSLVADLTHINAGVSDDAALAARLRAAGVDVAALDAGLSARIKTSFDLTVLVELPDGKQTTVRVAPGQERTVSVVTTTVHSGRLAALAGAAVAALVGLALILFAGLSARRARRGRR
jgi:hypothetical protein